MARLNRRRDVLMGTGGLPGSVNGRPFPFPSYGGGCWVDDDTVLVALAPSGVLARWRWREPGAQPVVIQPARGSTGFAGGGGRWIAIMPPNDRAGTPSFLYGNTIGVRDGAGFGDVADDGTIVFKTLYNSFAGLTIVPPSGPEIIIPDGSPTDLQALPGGRAQWRGGAYGRAAVRPAVPAQRVLLIELDGEDWLVYFHDSPQSLGLIAQLDGALDGYLLAPLAYHYDAKRVDGQLVVAWSRTDGEGPHDGVIGTVDRSQPRVQLGTKPPIQRERGPVNREKEPMEAKPLPSDVHAIVVALHARNLKLANGSDDDRRALQKMICETVRARKGRRWGWKSNQGVNVANAKDAIAELPDGMLVLGERQPLYMWDLFNGTTREPNPLPVMSETEHVEQFFVIVEPIDHLAGVVTPPVQPPSQPPTPPPAPPVSGLDEAAIRRIVQDELSKPRNVALKTSLGYFICEDRDQTGTPDGSPALLANRTSDGPWETFTLVPK